EPVTLDTPARDRSSFREHGVYLITGGLGNVGSAIAEYLARRYQARLVLVGRSRTRGRDTIERLQALGADVAYVSANVADVTGMRRGVDQAYERFGTLNGVIHAAGIVSDNGLQEISDCNHENCQRHFESKAYGLLALKEVLDGKPLDFCLLVSSLTSVLGGVGHAAYASSNAYMDAFARRHNRSQRVPWISVNFDLWRFHDRTAVDSGFGRTVQDLGHTPEEAAGAMEASLAARSASQLLVSTGNLAARISQWITLESLSTPSQPSDVHAYDDAPADDIERRVARIWQDALGVDAVGSHESFAELGGHSLLAIRIVAELRRAFQIDLPIKAIFDTPTVAALSSHIKELIIADIAALTDEEARRLVSSE
ncbi:MAG TPA: SDR family NAD(P)-dependent oxidoreductase, partial [Woeseiaceae bacterium]|nr:SDR family NAD(P)-dependent oxidoreductase [Woeseiaceae bacterium]